MTLDNIMLYKELVLSGVPKIITGEEFASIEEKDAVIYFINNYGIPVNTPNLSEHLLNATGRVEETEVLINHLKEGINNIFSGSYGI